MTERAIPNAGEYGFILRENNIAYLLLRRTPGLVSDTSYTRPYTAHIVIMCVLFPCS